jgi:ComF family protein
MRIIDTILNLLFPPKCVLCAKILEKEETDLCHNCRTEISECGKSKRAIPFIESWLALWYYEGKVRSSLLRYKFGGRRGYAKIYGRLLAMKLLREYPEGFDVLTWIPVSRFRKFTRGYDQVELLAEAVGKELGMKPVCTMKKVRHNRPQSRISGSAKRRANVLGVYRITDPVAVAGKRVLLLDDIVTTGSTAGECARVLLTCGAKEVHLGCIAAAIHHKQDKR